MTDTYSTVAGLMRFESHHVNIHSLVAHRSRIAVVAPHAGRIEPVTGELARAVAGDDHRLYCFSGRAATDNSRLHVTSTRFTEPGLSDVLRGAVTVLTIHGSRGPADAVTLIGGRNLSLRHHLQLTLQAAEFNVERALPPLAGRHPENVTNRTPAGGVQLEISRSQRVMLKRALRDDQNCHQLNCSCQFCRYITAIRVALNEYVVETLPA